ncbi:MAG: Rv3235 family protein [Nocardioidaceae bacterium]
MTRPVSPSLVRPLPVPNRRTWRPADGLAEPGGYTQGALALCYPLPAGLPTDPCPTGLVVVPHGARPGPAQGSDAWAATFVQAVVEVVACDRPVTQLVRWTTREVYAEILRRQQNVARHRRDTGVRSLRQHVATVRLCQPWPECAEIAARVTFGSRSRALAARLDRLHGRWLCTAIQFG